MGHNWKMNYFIYISLSELESEGQTWQSGRKMPWKCLPKGLSLSVTDDMIWKSKLGHVDVWEEDNLSATQLVWWTKNHSHLCEIINFIHINWKQYVYRDSHLMVHMLYFIENSVCVVHHVNADPKYFKHRYKCSFIMLCLIRADSYYGVTRWKPLLQLLFVQISHS